MDSKLHGNYSSKVFVLGRTFLTLKNCEMTMSRRRLKWSQRPTRRGVMRTYLYLVNEIRIALKDPTRVRETMRSQPHN
jgi:hypothetical protein